MGCCHISTNHKLNITTREQLNAVIAREYPRRAMLNIKQRNNKGQIRGTKITQFSVTEPILTSSQKIEINSKTY